VDSILDGIVAVVAWTVFIIGAGAGILFAGCLVMLMLGIFPIGSLSWFAVKVTLVSGLVGGGLLYLSFNELIPGGPH